MTVHLAFFLTNWFHYFYIPHAEPWYHGNVWGNLFVIAVIAPLGWLWSKTKFWPLRPIKHGITALHTKLDKHHAEVMAHHEHQTRLIEEVHYLAHTGKPHPRVENRINAKKSITPIKPSSVK